MSTESDENNLNTCEDNILKKFDAYVFLFAAVVLSVLKIIELIFKKKQNNNFKILDTFNEDLSETKTNLKHLQNEQLELTTILSGIQTGIQTKEQSPDSIAKTQTFPAPKEIAKAQQQETEDLSFAKENLKRFSKSMININEK